MVISYAIWYHSTTEVSLKIKKINNKYFTKFPSLLEPDVQPASRVYGR